MNNYNLHNLFSIPLMKFDYGEISNDENKIFDHYLNDLVPSCSYNRFISKENYILDNNDLPKLKKFIESAINDYVENVLVGGELENDLSFKITQSWLNLSKPDSGGHYKHTHSNSLISGVFYIKADPNLDSILFTNDYLFSNAINLQDRVKKFNNFNSNRWRVPVSTGNLFLFPSNLPHEVDALGGEENRISLSFNSFPFGVLGSKSELTELRILQDKQNDSRWMKWVP